MKAALLSSILFVSLVSQTLARKGPKTKSIWREFDLEDLYTFFENVDWYGFKSSFLQKNSGNFYEHVYNDYFASFREENELYLPNNPAAIKAKLSDLEQLVIAGTLSRQNKTEWQPFATQLVYSFGNETAAMMFNEIRQVWIICGYVNLTDTFIGGDEVSKMCASCESIGITSPTRDPIPGKDYIPIEGTEGTGGSVSPTPTPTPAGSNKKTKGGGNSQRLIMADDIAHSRLNERVINVDLLYTSDAEACSSSKMYDSCAAFCCYSEYRTTDFCGGSLDKCL